MLGRLRTVPRFEAVDPSTVQFLRIDWVADRNLNLNIRIDSIPIASDEVSAIQIRGVKDIDGAPVLPVV
jgi:hypothetical protein